MFNPLKRLVHRLRRASGRLPDRTRQTHADEAVARRLHQRFEHDLEHASINGLHFYVQGGVVTIYGTVSHTLDRDLLVSAVEQTTGVRDVVDHLQTES